MEYKDQRLNRNVVCGTGLTRGGRKVCLRKCGRRMQLCEKNEVNFWKVVGVDLGASMFFGV